MPCSIAKLRLVSYKKGATAGRDLAISSQLDTLFYIPHEGAETETLSLFVNAV